MSSEKRRRQRENRSSRVEAAAAQQSPRRALLTGGIVAGLAVIVMVALAFGDDDVRDDTGERAEAAIDTTTTEPASTDQPAVETGCPAEDGSSPRTIDFDGPPQMCIDVTETHVAIFDTSEGEVRVTLDSTDTPITANNFVTLARWGYYDGTTLFRTDPSIDIIQGGAPHTESPSDPGPGYTIPDEPAFEMTADGQLIGPYRYEPGQLVMARTFAPDSASAQFFFSTGPNTALLDGQGVYVVFGRTDDAGLAVLQQIIGLHEPGGPLGGAPSRTCLLYTSDAADE